MSIKKETIYAKGRRKTATAIITKSNVTLINKKPLQDYFHNREDLIKITMVPINLCNIPINFKVTVKGGGIHAQAEAIRVAIARLIAITNPEFVAILNPFMRFDTRQVERKKAGYLKARKESPHNKR